MINQLSTRINSEMKLPALQVGDAGSNGSAQPAGQPVGQMKSDSATTAHVMTAESKPSEPRTQDPKPADAKAPSKPATQVAQAKPAHKMDMKTAMLYSKALEEEDAGNKSKAVELYKQVVAKFPEYAPAQAKIEKLSRS